MKKLFYSVFALALASFSIPKMGLAQNQGHFCGTDHFKRELIGRNPLLVQAMQANEELLQNAILEMRGNRDEEAILVIPVVFHVIHNYGPENISDAQIHNAIDVLNRDYNKLNGDTSAVINEFKNIIADVKLEFRLATKDFQGNCTNGIERLHSMYTYLGDEQAKLNQWPRDRYLNIWVVNFIEGASQGVTLGYSMYPSTVVGDFYGRLDGIMAVYNAVGEIGASSPDRGRTLTHEVGHYLNLIHTWGEQEPNSACGGTDAVDDTPETRGQFSTCDLIDIRCGNPLQGALIYGFSDVTTNSGVIDPTPPYIVPNDDLTLGAFRANSVSANPVAAGTFGFSNWGDGALDGETEYSNLTGSLNTNKYYEFTLTPNAGRAMTLSSLLFDVRRSSTGPRTFALRSSLDDFGSNIQPGSGSTNNILISVQGGVYFFNTDDAGATFLGNNQLVLPAGFSLLRNAVTFRVYAWNSEGSEGSFEIDEIKMNGMHGTIANVQNYMDYSSCSLMFTNGQKERMRAALSVSVASRNNLWTQANRINTGTWDPVTAECAPKADFYTQQQFGCVNTPIQFRDNSTNATVQSWFWTFQDGIPATSTEQNPLVSFTSGGFKDVTLTVTGIGGEDTKTRSSVVRITPDSPEFWDIPLSEGFDSDHDFFYLWTPVNVDNNSSSWHRATNAGFSNNTSARLDAYNMDVTEISNGGGSIDELVSPSFTLSGLSNVTTLSFRYAFATQGSDILDINDRLESYYSLDCGKTWFGFTSGTIYLGVSGQQSISGGTISGLSLVTAGSNGSYFIPTDQSHWRQAVLNIPSVSPNSKFRFKFVFKGGDYPNNLYIDDVNINATVGIEEQSSDFYGVNLFPNPSNYSTTLTYTNKTNAPVQISLIDMSGRVVESWTPNNNAPGQKILTINTGDLAKGVYMVNMRSAQNNYTIRLLVQ